MTALWAYREVLVVLALIAGAVWLWHETRPGWLVVVDESKEA